jgi:CRP/FNR family transcriptional regulator, cyclic AMP receptor protein
MAVLEGIALFDGLSESQLAAVNLLCEPAAFAVGATITTEGEMAADFFVLLDGEVSISKKLRLPNIVDGAGEDRTLTVISSEKNPVLGETALVGGTHRLASMKCLTDCRMLRIDTSKLNDLLQADPGAGQIVFRNLALMIYRRLEAANTDVVKLSAALVYALQA